MSNPPETTRVLVGVYIHRYECACGWASFDCDNGDAAAGAALVRHMLDHARSHRETTE